MEEVDPRNYEDSLADIGNVIVSSRSHNGQSKLAPALPRTSPQPLRSKGVGGTVTKRYSSHNPRNAGQVLPDFAPIHMNPCTRATGGRTFPTRLVPNRVYIYTYIRTNVYMYIDVYVCVCAAHIEFSQKVRVEF